jgi:chromosomal replication initiation ATPase DnaA
MILGAAMPDYHTDHLRKVLGADAAAPRTTHVDAMEMAVAAAFGIPPAQLRAPTRRSAASALARQTAMYLAHVAFGLSFTEVGQFFGRDRTTAAHACRRVEDRRDDPVVNALVVRLENACVAPARGRVANEACR